MSLFDRIFKGNPAERQSPLDIALINAIITDSIDQAMQAISSGANPNSVDRNGLPAILLSASRQQVKIVEALIKSGADINKKGTDKKQKIFNSSALIAASANGNINIVKALSDANADKNITDDTGLTPLMSAAYMGNDNIVALLIQNGASIEQKDEKGYTALMFASNAGKINSIKVLLENNANVNAKDIDNSTPVMFASQHGFNDVVRLLLFHGADRNFKGNYGLNAIDFAKQNSLNETIEILEKN
jgi:ankyrin repeat protein